MKKELNTVTVFWENQNNIWWSEICAKIVEHFGLPGGKYKTEVSSEYMNFTFKNKHDALMCKMLISESI